MAQTLLKNAHVITMDAHRNVLPAADVLIDGERISDIGHIEDASGTAEVIDCAGKIVLPGFVNTHVHTAQQLGRGLADDVDLLTFLRARIWPYESSLTSEDQYLSATACCIEMIKSGVTAFAELGAPDVNAVGRAVRDIGMRCALARCTMDGGEGLPTNWIETTDFALDREIEGFESWHDAAQGRIKYWFSVRTIFNASEDLLVGTKRLADRYNTGIHMHVAELPEEIDFVKAKTGMRTVEYLDRLGVLGPNFLSVHTVWLTHSEVDLLRLHDVKVSHNLASNMRVLGFAPVPEMLSKGVTVALGTDGAACNNRMDMVDEMYLAALINKGKTHDPTVLPAETVLEMATLNGAKAILQDDSLGSLEPGKYADLIIVNLDDMGSLPVHDPISNIVYAMHSSNVESSMCNGQWLMRDRAILTVNETEIRHEIREAADEIRKRSGIALPDRFSTALSRT